MRLTRFRGSTGSAAAVASGHRLANREGNIKCARLLKSFHRQVEDILLQFEHTFIPFYLYTIPPIGLDD